MTDLIAVIANKDRRRNGGLLSDKVTAAFTELLQEPLREHSPHQFETIEVIGVDGERRPIKIFPRAWIKRLEKAIAVGAFSRLAPSEIAQRILSTEEPAT